MEFCDHLIKVHVSHVDEELYFQYQCEVDADQLKFIIHSFIINFFMMGNIYSVVWHCYMYPYVCSNNEETFLDNIFWNFKNLKKFIVISNSWAHECSDMFTTITIMQMVKFVEKYFYKKYIKTMYYTVFSLSEKTFITDSLSKSIFFASNI